MMPAKKRSASDSLAKLSRGLTRETPASRSDKSEEAPEEAQRTDASGEAKPTEATPAGFDAGNPSERPAPRKTGRPRTKSERMMRVSVDLPRHRHKYLRDFAYDTETDGMSVVRALLEEMAEDPELEHRVRNRLLPRG